MIETWKQKYLYKSVKMIKNNKGINLIKREALRKAD